MKNADGSKTRDPTFADTANTRAYTLGVSQILTRNLLAVFNFEAITDEGYLNSPYRSVRYVSPGDPRGFALEKEIYPRTHTSTAAAGILKYYLPGAPPLKATIASTQTRGAWTRTRST
ncbi:MAG: DUF3570 domain-containing protein [Gammaproteobacteria bacterium]